MITFFTAEQFRSMIQQLIPTGQPLLRPTQALL